MSRLLAVCCILSLCAGCSQLDEYDILIKNVGSKGIDDAHVCFGEFRSIGGILSPGRGKLHGNPEHPIPEKATVEWRTEDGVMHREEVEVLKHIPKGFRGDIQFEIDDDNSVTVRVIPEKPGSD